jgi:hypothetical protein
VHPGEIERRWGQSRSSPVLVLAPRLAVSDELFELIRAGQCWGVTVNDGVPALVTFTGLRRQWHYTVSEHDVARHEWVLRWSH